MTKLPFKDGYIRASTPGGLEYYVSVDEFAENASKAKIVEQMLDKYDEHELRRV